MPRTPDYIHEDSETAIDLAQFWKLVAMAIRAGQVQGFTPSPRVDPDEDARQERAAELVRRAIERGRRKAGV